jgi:cytochrome b subunit of formate dehydrogenase
VSLSLRTAVNNLPEQLKIVIGQKFFRSILSPLFLYVGFMLAINQLSGIILELNTTLHNFLYISK